VSRIGALIVVALAVVLAGQAFARRSPGYHGKHHTRTTAFTGWALSYRGSASWHVTETGTYSNGDSFTDDESSVSQWHYPIPTTNGAAAGFAVTYPTTCRQFRQIACPQTQVTAVGKGPSELDYRVNDSTTTGSPAATDRLQCSATNKADGGAFVSIHATYLRATDAYRIAVLNDPLPSRLLGPNPRCSGSSTNGLTQQGLWVPPTLPSDAPSLSHWWATRTVTIPASAFATYSQIEIPVTLLERNVAPRNCGIVSPSIQCQATGHWSGLLILHRTAR